MIDSVLDGIDSFYAEVLGTACLVRDTPELCAHQPAPGDLDATFPPALQSTDFSSQDDLDFDEPTDVSPSTAAAT